MSCAKFTNEFGDIDEPFYISIESMLDDLAVMMRNNPELYPKFQNRLGKLEKSTSGIGWGFHDHIADVVSELEKTSSNPNITCLQKKS